MGCCCGGCPGTACSNCSDATPIALFASISGATFMPTGTCQNTSGCGAVASLKIDYPGSSSIPDISSCLNQLTTTCFWGCDSFISVYGAGYSRTTYGLINCSSIPQTAGFANARIKIAAQPTGWEIWGYFDTSPNLLFFHSTASASPVVCSTVDLTFTNDVVLGQCYTQPCSGPTDPATCVGVATGGTAVLQFQQSCCP